MFARFYCFLEKFRLIYIFKLSHHHFLLIMKSDYCAFIVLGKSGYTRVFVARWKVLNICILWKVRDKLLLQVMDFRFKVKFACLRFGLFSFILCTYSTVGLFILEIIIVYPMNYYQLYKGRLIEKDYSTSG